MNQNPTSIASYPTVKTIVLVANREQKSRWQGVLGTYNLSRTSTSGITSPTPSTKLRILATSVSHPAMRNAPPKSVEPTYPAERVNHGLPPSTMVAPPTCGSIVSLSIRPPERIACGKGNEARLAQVSKGMDVAPQGTGNETRCDRAKEQRGMGMR